MTFTKLMALAIATNIALQAAPVGAMDSPNQDTEVTASQLNAIAFVPPRITLDQYMNVLVMGEPIEGWGDMSGNIGSWLQCTANKNRIQNTAGELLENLEFFPLYNNPQIDDSRLRWDYSLPIPGQDSSRGESILFLYKDATPEEIEIVKLLPEEDISQKISRARKWVDTLNEMRVSNNVLSTLFEGLILPTRVSDFNVIREKRVINCYSDFIHKRNKKNIIHVETDGLKFKSCSAVYNGNTNHYRPDGNHDHLVKTLFPDFVRGSYGDIITYENTANLSVNGFKVSGLVFDFNGDFKINMGEGELMLDHVQVLPSGKFSIRSQSENCPIEKINMIPADNSQPMVISALMKLTENMKMNLECINISRMQIKFRLKK